MSIEDQHCRACAESGVGACDDAPHALPSVQDWADAKAGDRTNLDRALSVDRTAYAVGQEVYVSDFQRDEHFTGIIRAIDWSRGAGPLIIEDVHDVTRVDGYQPWDVTPVPKTLEEVEAFLAG